MRNLYLVAYDISDPKRLRKIFKTMKGYGTRIQYSVFYCYLSNKEKVILIAYIDDIIDHKSDRVIIVNLGSEERSTEEKIEFLGQKMNISDHEAIIV